VSNKILITVLVTVASLLMVLGLSLPIRIVFGYQCTESQSLASLALIMIGASFAGLALALNAEGGK
jgi:hypothetical protein